MKRFLALIKVGSHAAWQWLKDLPSWSKYAAAVLLVAVLAGLLIWKWGFRKQIDTGLIRRSPARVENLWFLHDGTLVGTRRDPNLVFSQWKEQSAPSTADNVSFGIVAVGGFLGVYQQARFPRETDQRGELPFRTSIMQDGSAAVIYYRGLLAIVGPEPFSGWRKTLPLPSRDQLSDFEIFYTQRDWGILGLRDFGPDPAKAPATIAVTDNGLIALAYQDGRVEFIDPRLLDQTVGGRKTNQDKPTFMKPVGNFLAVVSAPNASVVILNVNSTTATSSHGYPPAAQPKLAISDYGRLAVSNGTNEVFLTKEDGSGDANIPIRAYGDVDTVSFFDQNRVIVGGYFQDVFLLEENQLPYKLATAPKGVNAVAVNANRLAYAGDDGLVLLWHTKRRVLNRFGWAIIFIFGVFFLAAAAVYVWDYKKNREEAVIEPVPIPVIDEPPRLRLPDVPSELVKAFREGECVLYCGSGVSAQAGFPYWQPFVEDLTEWTISSGFVVPELGASLRAALEQKQYDSVSDNLVSIMRERQAELNGYLRQTFFQDTALPESVKLLKDLPFSGAMTTNFDNLLEQAFADKSAASLTPSDADRLLQCLHKREFFLLKLYGKLEQPATVMLAPSQYDDVVRGNLVFSSFMETLLISRTVFFVGSSLEGIQAYLKGMPLPRQSRRTHYALVPVTGEAWQAKANPLKERYGIQVLPYSPTEGHPELLKFLQDLNTQVKAEGETGRLERRSVLKKISVTDIGPFENLELKFDPHWNILLGDNGVGKSSIIKAIAIAILGDDSKSYAQRIIKSGKPNSIITLESGRNTYTTRLFRKNGEAKVESVPGRAFEAEGWLAVAFPPLRTMSWQRPKSVETGTTGRERPTTNDLLPVIAGEADPRLDQLKQWIVNVDYEIKDARSRNQKEIPQERLLEDFFNVVGQLTAGTKLKFKEVNPATKEITVITDDGELPIEALSQGMTSLIGWVGILLQRMYEVYGKDKGDPKEQYALVIMDEIDAHLHPAWQQTLTRKLGKIFPNVQFIATTHSPLIVGGMKPAQIIRFARDEEHKVVTYAITEEMTIGRADQILSSDLFGLESTMTLNEDLEVLMEEYDDLMANEERNEDQERRFRELRETLKTRIPLVSEMPAEQKALGLLEALLEPDGDGDGDFRSVNKKLLKQAEALLIEVSKNRK